MPIIYHYCSLSSLFSIISKKELWLSSLRSSYDTNEFVSSLKVLQKTLKENRPNVIPDDYVFKGLHRSHLTNFYYLSCTSMKDSSIHFESYGNTHEGVAIGFNTDALKRLNYKSFKTFINGEIGIDIVPDWFVFNEVIYDNESQMKEMFDNINKEFISQNNKIPKDEIEKKIFMNKILQKMIDYFRPIFKIQNFESEKEYRLIFNPLVLNGEMTDLESLVSYEKPKDYETRKKTPALDIYFYEHKDYFKRILNALKTYNDKLGLSENIVYKYISDEIREVQILKLDELIKLGFIDNIILGSLCTQNTKELKSFLKSQDVTCKVTRSNITIKK